MSVHVVSESESRTPRVSVIVPALNSARTIGRCMEALGAQQTAHLFEVIVVHSGEDDTCAVAAAALPPARTVQLPERALAARARAAGVAVARGDIFAFIDSDAYAAPDWIEQVVRSAESGRDLICGSIGNANPDSAVARAEQLVMFSEFLSETPQRPMWFALSGNLVMRRAAYERFGPFVEIRASEDLIFSRRVAMAGGTILFAPRMRVFHDNRRRLRPYLRNQLLLGTYTAMARRVVPFEDSRSWPLFLALLPIAPAAKLAKIVWRLVRWCPRQLLALARGVPAGAARGDRLRHRPGARGVLLGGGARGRRAHRQHDTVERRRQHVAEPPGFASHVELARDGAAARGPEALAQGGVRQQRVDGVGERADVARAGRRTRRPRPRPARTPRRRASTPPERRRPWPP